MMEKRLALLTKNISCPVCKRDSTLVSINPRLYVAADRESDMHVVSYRWAEQIPDVTPPHYFAVWQCSQCLFADLADCIDKPSGSHREDLLHEAYVSSSSQQRAVLHDLRQLVTGDEPDFRGALALHLAALYIAGLPQTEHVDHNKLSRIALRLGWLFREGGDVSFSTASAGMDAMSRLQEEVESVQSQLATMGSTLGNISQRSRERTAELGIEDDEDSPYASITASLLDKYEEIRTLLTAMQRAVIRDTQGTFGAGIAKMQSTTDSLAELLLPLHARWPEMPVSEEQSLRIAISALDYYYQEETSAASIEQSMRVVLLVIDLLCRVGDQEEALRYVAEIYKTGMRDINALTRRMNEARKAGTLRNHDEKMIKRKIGNIQLSIRQAGEARHELLELLYERHLEAIKSVASQAAGKTPRQIEHMLGDAGVPEEMFGYLKKRGILK